jgi:hypothetical protein
MFEGTSQVFRSAILVALAWMLSGGYGAAWADESDRIRPYEANPHYWQYKGRPVLLLGGSDDDNLFQWPAKRLTAQLDTLVACGGNYVRNTMSDRDEGNLYAFARVAERYDLDHWNEEYWQRFESFLRLTAERGVIVQIELWDMWDLVRGNWARHPFNPRNNVNYTAAESSLLTDVPFNPAEEPTKHNFLHTVPELENNVPVLRFQEAFIDRVLKVSLPFPNVLYCINNESGEPPEWSRFWAKYIHRRAKERGIDAQVTDMRRREDITHATHRTVYDDTEVYTFADVSQNTGNQIRDHELQYRRLLEVREYLASAPRPINNVKIYRADDRALQIFWRNLFAGCAATRFHRPYPASSNGGWGLTPTAQTTFASARMLMDRFDLFAGEPRNDLLSERSSNEAYCLAKPGKQYAVYFPEGGEVKMDVSGANGMLQVRWLNIARGRWQEPDAVDGGEILELKTPDDGHWAALVLAR